MRVIVVEDQALLRDGLVRLFTDKGHDVVGSTGDTNGLADLVAATEPDLVVLDLRMPPTFTDEGATAARSLKAARPELGVLLLSQHIDKSSVVDLVAKPGFGYLLEDGSSRSMSSSTPPNGWPAADRHWTPRSCPRSWPPKRTVRSRASPHANSTCSS